MISEDLLQRAESGDLAALVELDGQGLLLGAEESLADYTTRLRHLQANVGKMDGELAAKGTFTVEDITVERDQRIPPEIFAEPRDLTQRLFHFAIDWVPGFFITPPGILFGGCSYYFFPDFFALFTIRRAFAEKDHWLIYRRTELLAHELCHIARIGLGSHEYEEVFAYRTSGSGFRRAIGGIFRSPSDSYSFLGSAFLILLGRMAQILKFPSLPQWPFWLPFLLVLAYHAVRHTASMRRLAQARENLAPVCGELADAVLFRCTDAEIHILAEPQDTESIQAWIEAQDAWRWRVIRQRFLTA